MKKITFNGSMIWAICFFIILGLTLLVTNLMEQGLRYSRYLFWILIVSQGINTFIFLAFSSKGTAEKIFVLGMYGLWIFTPILAFSPRWPIFQDEIFHIQLANLISANGNNSVGLLSSLSVAKYYPGIELLAVATADITDLTIFHTGRLLIGICHSMILVTIYIALKRIIKSDIVAILGAFFFTVNRSYSYFHCVFSYESIGIYFFVLIIYLIAINRRNRSFSFSLCTILTMLALVVTHHFSSYQMGLLLVIYLAIAFYSGEKNKDSPKTIYLVLLYITFVFSWIVYLAIMTVEYFNSILFERVKSLFLMSLLEVREGFSSVPLPAFELFINRYCYIPFLVSACIYGVYLIIKKDDYQLIKKESIVQTIIAYGPFLFIISLPLTLKEGGEPIFRSWPFFFVGISILLAISTVSLLGYIKRARVAGKGLISLMTISVIGVLIMGGFNIDFGNNLLTRVKGVYAAGPETLTPDVFYSSSWFRSYVGIDKIIYGDKTINWIYGDVQYINLEKSAAVFMAKEFSSKIIPGIPDNYYIISDCRITDRMAKYQTYFSGKRPMVGLNSSRYGFDTPMPGNFLEKFDRVPEIDSGYNNGNIIIYLKDLGEI